MTECGPPDPRSPGDERYARQVILPEIGPQGQARLGAAAVLVVGAGGLGSAALEYLAAAGIGTIGIAEPDVVELTNLHRQPIYSTVDVGRGKAAAAAARIAAINPGVRTVILDQAVTPANAAETVRSFDVVLDCTDNFPARYALNDACVRTAKPLVHAAVHRFEARIGVFGFDGGPCLRCVHPEPPPGGLVRDCAAEGVLGVLPGIAGALQASEALKVLTGAGAPLSGRMLLADLLRPSFTVITIRRDPACRVCGGEGARTQPGTAGRGGAGLPAEGDPDAARSSPIPPSISPAEFRGLINSGAPVTVLDVREHEEYAGHNIGGVHIPLRLLQSKLAALDRSATVVVVCESGSRSLIGAVMLAAAGFPSVRNLSGGLDALRRL